MNKSTASVIGCAVAAVMALVVQTDHGLKTSDEGLAFIAKWEGCRSEAYQCSADVWTIGLGHTQGVKAGDTATLPDISNAFIEDIAKAENVVNRHTDLPAGKEFDMAVSFVFNLGAGNFQHSTFLKRIKADDLVMACREFPRWVYVNGKDCRDPASNCPGIVTRRAEEKEICLNGYPQI